MPSSPPRSRGGQPGNNNALKHGFYTRRFHKQDLSGVGEINAQSLAEEVAVMRVLARRLVEACSPDADLYELAGVLRAVCLASTTITRVIKVHAFLASQNPDTEAAITRAINSIIDEMVK
jgi:hypothetical protein